jgi:4'-phosphopantetheinyl transferase
MMSSATRARIDLEDRCVHVWPLRLEASNACFQHATALLAADEAARAKRFHFERHRKAFVLGRAVLRVLLGRMLGTAPECIQFRYGPKGKPVLTPPCRLCFNASNSGDLAACAFTLECPLGVDIEQLRPIREIQDIARRFFAVEEVTELMSLPKSEQPGGFFRCWTRKEAYIKAVGDGLSVPLDSFRVTLRANDPVRLVQLGGSAEAAQNWSMHDFTPAPGYFGALAYPDQQRSVEIHPLRAAQDLLESL